jgi:hypothetical protein
MWLRNVQRIHVPRTGRHGYPGPVPEAVPYSVPMRGAWIHEGRSQLKFLSRGLPVTSHGASLVLHSGLWVDLGQVNHVQASKDDVVFFDHDHCERAVSRG